MIGGPTARRPHSIGSYETGFSTDFADVMGSIELERQTMTGSTQFMDDTETPYIPPGSPSDRYVGPGKEAHDAWMELVDVK
ncbi:hypothetical protein BST61_g1394 [Cercospora zeina]